MSAADVTDLAALSRLLDEAFDLTADAFDAWAAALPDADRRLLPRLRDLLAGRASSAGRDFLSRGPALDASPLRDETVAHDGETVGPYRLIREIGIGGMGSVWLAERIDGGLKRNVALKLPRLAWGAGLAERMARERDIGALLEHPRIARLYDAGVDQRGRPYLAFEYIEGRPIDAWCASRALDVRARVALFVQVVRAVGYAHGRLIVHRDLKPSNILVSDDGQAHLLDFGIAKLLHETAQATSDLTRDEGRLLTLHYASPEQIDGQAIGVASDIYSLGVVLYELLCGALPYRPDRRTAAAMEQAILAGDPAPPSSKASTAGDRRALVGELDAIVGKALKRDPRERYATADGLADDLQRHLDGERVLAQPDSFRYRAGKVLRRHRVGFAATTLVVLAVVGGTGAVWIQAKRANDAAERARVVKDFVTDVFRVNEMSPDHDDGLRQMPAEMLLEHGAQLIETRFARQPQLQAELYGVVGGIFAEMGADELAADYARRLIDVLDRTRGDEAARAAAQLRLGIALFRQGRIRDAQASAREAVRIAQHEPLVREQAELLLAKALFEDFHDAEAVPLLDAIEAAQRARGGGPSAGHAEVARLRAVQMVKANRYADADRLYTVALDEALTAEGPRSMEAVEIRLSFEHDLVFHSEPERARRLLDQALAVLRANGRPGEIRAAEEESSALSAMYFNAEIPFEQARDAGERALAVVSSRGVPAIVRASVAFHVGDVELLRGDVARAAQLMLPSTPILLTQQTDLRARSRTISINAELLSSLGRHDEAAAALLESFNLWNQATPTSRHPIRALAYAQRALDLVMAGRFDEADAVLASAPTFATLTGAPARMDFLRNLIPAGRARVALERGDAGAALALLPPLDPDTRQVSFPYDDRMLRGEVLCAVGRRSEGLALLDESMRLEEPRVDPHHPFLAREQALAGLCALGLGQRRRARELATVARASFVIQPEVSPYFKRPLERLEQALGTVER